MRAIRFRAWDTLLKSWLGDGYLMNNFGTVLANPDWVVMQYTGLKDKNGKEIYEGDLLLVFDEAVVPVTDEGQGPVEECNHIVAVEIRNGVWGFEIPKSDDGETGWYGLHYWSEEISSEGYEIIGNIYSNPELLK
jgi:uncharacterized phage protein (TIGR01671 family)